MLDKDDLDSSSINKSINQSNDHLIKNNSPLIGLIFRDSPSKQIHDTQNIEIKLKNATPIEEVFETQSSNESSPPSSDKESEKGNEELADPLDQFTSKFEFEYLIREKEKLKRKEFKRRELISKKLNFEDQKQINQFLIDKIIKDETKTSEFGIIFRRIKYYDMVISIVVIVNILISLIENYISLNNSNNYFNKEIVLKSNNLNNSMNQSLIIYNDQIYNYNEDIYLYYSLVENRLVSYEENTLRFINIIVVLANEILIYFRYKYYLDIMKIQRRVSKYDNFFTSGLYKVMLIEALIMGTFYPPYLNKTISGRMLELSYIYDWNSIVCFAVLFKSYIILRVYSYFSRWTSDTANSVCIKYKVEVGVHFAIKAELKKRPLKMLIIMMIFFLFFLGFGTKTFETNIISDSTDLTKGTKPDLEYYKNCLWLIIVVMTTVGYGDVVPRSHLGRFICFVACIIGMLLVSLIVVSLSNISEFTKEEKKAHSFIKKLQAEDNMKYKATKVIITIIQLRKSFFRKNKQSRAKFEKLVERFCILSDLKNSLNYFKDDLKVSLFFSLPIDEMLNNLEGKLKSDIKEMMKGIVELNLKFTDIEKLDREQKEFAFRIKKLNKIQESIGNHFVNLNNDFYRKEVLSKELNKKIEEEVQEEEEE